jgi:hypothetical protein
MIETGLAVWILIQLGLLLLTLYAWTRDGDLREWEDRMIVRLRLKRFARTERYIEREGFRLVPKK